MGNTPNIRFKGFTDDWEQRKLGDEAIEMLAGGDIDKSRVVDSGKYPIYANALTNDGVVGYYNDTYRVKAPAVTVTGRGDVGHAQARMIDFTPVVRLLAIRSEHDSYFLENAINNCTVAVESTGVPQLTVPQLAAYRIYFPASLEEEIKIGECFHNLDNLITLHQRKCDETKELKKFMLQKMFPKNGEKKPEIRFEGFTDDWEQRKLSDEFADFIVPMRDKPKEFGGNIPWTRIEDIEGKYLNDSLSGQYVTEETVKKMNLKIIPKDSLIVSSSATFGVVAVITQDLITNQTFIGLVPNNKDTLDYWYAFFHSDEPRKYMRLESAGSTIFYIARESFENMPIKVPSKDEMIKIGSYFDNLDNLITLHQRKCDEIKEIKKFMLQNMFPQKG